MTARKLNNQHDTMQVVGSEPLGFGEISWVPDSDTLLVHVEETSDLEPWLDVLAVRNVVAGRRTKHDQWVNLVLQGSMPNGFRITVSKIYHDPDCVEMVDKTITREDPAGLIRRLLELESRDNAHTATAEETP